MSLKDEGNALFKQKRFKEAHQKYTWAIELDSSNAIIFANRAACSLSLKKYRDALSDAKQATEVDPSYPKAFARLATAYDCIGHPYHSVPYWKAAIDLLTNKGSLAPAERAQLSEYRTYLTQAEEYLLLFRAGLTLTGRPQEDPSRFHQLKAGQKGPWEKARILKPRLLEEQQLHSSAFVIDDAASELERAYEIMQELVVSGDAYYVSEGAYNGRVGALEAMSNAVIRESRIFMGFAISLDPQFMANQNQQVLFEVAQTRALTWCEEGPVWVKAKIPEMLASGGWEVLRPLLESLIRTWIIRGFMEHGLRDNSVMFLEMLSTAVELIVWVRQTYPHVSDEERGSVFSLEFLRGLRRLRFEAFRLNFDPQSADAATEFEGIKAEAESIIEEIMSHPRPPLTMHSGSGTANVGTQLTLHDYCHGKAHAMVGHYHEFKGRFGGDKTAHFEQAVHAFCRAAEALPVDDEEYSSYYATALKYMPECPNMKVGQALDVVDKLKLAKPKRIKIWKHSMGAVKFGLDEFIDDALESSEGPLRAHLAKGGSRGDELGRVQGLVGLDGV